MIHDMILYEGILIDNENGEMLDLMHWEIPLTFFTMVRTRILRDKKMIIMDIIMLRRLGKKRSLWIS